MVGSVTANPVILYLLVIAYQLYLAIGSYDSSDTSLLSLSINSCSMGTRLSFQLYHLFTPLYGLMTSRYRRGDAVTPAPGEKDFHLHDYQVVKVQFLSFPCHPSLSFCSFRMNESHTLPINKLKGILVSLSLFAFAGIATNRSRDYNSTSISSGMPSPTVYTI